MAWLLLALSTGSAGVALWWAIKTRGRLNQIKQKYARVLDIDAYVEKEEADFARRREEAELELERLRDQSDKELKKLKRELGEL